MYNMDVSKVEIKLKSKGREYTLPYLVARKILSRKDSKNRYDVIDKLYEWDLEKNDFRRKPSKGENQKSAESPIDTGSDKLRKKT